MIGDRAYDSDPLDRELKKRGIEMIARTSTRAIQPQDRRKLRYGYKRRCLIERLFAGLMRCRRLVPRYDTKAEMFLGLLRLACARLLWNRYRTPASSSADNAARISCAAATFCGSTVITRRTASSTAPVRTVSSLRPLAVSPNS